MNEQHHRDPYDPYGEQERYRSYESYESHGQPQGQSQGHSQGQGAYAYPYDGQHAAAPAAAWPQAQQEEQPTQTWQAPTWETHTWERPLVPQEPAPAPAPAPADASYGAGEWQTAYTEEAARQNSHQNYAPYEPAPAAPAAAALAEPFAEPFAEPEPEPGPEPARPMTAAEKAKAEGRPQILPPGLQPALITAVLAALLAVAAPLARPVLAVPVVLLQAVTAAGWFRLNGMWPARQGIALAFLGGVVADVALLAVGASDVVKAPTVLLGTLGVWILLTLVLQLRSHAGADERLYGLTTATASAALAVIAAGHLAADPDAVVAGALGVAAAVVAAALPLPSAVSLVVALIAAAGAGVAGGQLTGMGPTGALLGLAAGVCALVGRRVASYDYPSRFVHMTAGVALPLALAAPAVYVLGRALA
ncbi:hypothetical protein GCM10010218_28920 [Streptomyces mashuensis]|uniref:Uncharacterized protein n=1 Tax=Streptomyces mashuensis TaxID=33904 RepID=A0A919B2E0_9ACTN|nr:hypothetical protein [Streptomyces mashuensis]GHF45916.1 hypothetical protein GCM10010218_28920 [Streptomyces mashuensis]